MGSPVILGDIGSYHENVVLRARGVDEFGIEQAMVNADCLSRVAAVGFGGARVVGIEDVDGAREIPPEGLAVPGEFAGWRSVGMAVNEGDYVIFGQGVPEAFEVLGGPVVFGAIGVEVE